MINGYKINDDSSYQRTKAILLIFQKLTIPVINISYPNVKLMVLKLMVIQKIWEELGPVLHVPSYLNDLSKLQKKKNYYKAVIIIIKIFFYYIMDLSFHHLNLLILFFILKHQKRNCIRVDIFLYFISYFSLYELYDLSYLCLNITVMILIHYNDGNDYSENNIINSLKTTVI